MLNDLFQLSLFPSYAFCDDLCYRIISGTILVCYLLLLSIIDIQRFLLPDRLTLSLLWSGLLLHAWFTPNYLASAVVGAATGYLSLWGLYWLMKWVTKKEGLGYGDFKMMAALGAWLGWESLPLVAVYASVMGTLFYAWRFFSLRHTGQLPFGPFLAVAGGVVYFSQ